MTLIDYISRFIRRNRMDYMTTREIEALASSGQTTLREMTRLLEMQALQKEVG